MNPEIKAKWINALRSGDYAQARSALARLDNRAGTESYCCLGVVCEIGVADGVLVSQNASMTRQYTTTDDADWARYESAVLPSGALPWLGLDDQNPEFRIGSSEDMEALTDSFEGSINPSTAFHKKDGYWWSSLASLNDAGATFNDIATVIEERF